MADRVGGPRRPIVSSSEPNVSPLDAARPGAAAAAARVLDGLRAEVVLARRVRLAPAWRFAVDTCSVPRLYYVARGAVRLERPGAPPLWAAAGDTLFLPRGGDHALATAVPDSAPTRSGLALSRLALSSVVSALRADPDRVLDVGRLLPAADPGLAAGVADGGATRGAELVACLVEVAPTGSTWLAALPPAVHVPAGAAGGVAGIADALPRLGGSAPGWPAGRTVARGRLAEAWLALAVSAGLADAHAAHGSGAKDGARGWLGALADERVGPVVAAVVADPAGRWTLPVMARTAGLSRAAFAARFRRVAGDTPHRFVTRVRVEAAARALRAGRTAAHAAAAAGYGGEAALRRAARRVTGRTPRELAGAR